MNNFQTLFDQKVTLMNLALQLHSEAEQYEKRATQAGHSYMGMTLNLIGTQLYDQSADLADRSANIEL